MQANIIADPLDTPTARQLRRQIQAHRKARLRWSDYVFYQVIEQLGFGRSLRQLPEHRLTELAEIIVSFRPPRHPSFEYDKQGKYMYSLQQKAGWSDLTLRQFMTIHFKKTHWNLLTPDEKTKTINILKEVTK